MLCHIESATAATSYKCGTTVYTEERAHAHAGKRGKQR